MREISELIYETCKTYLLTQGKFLLILWVFIGTIIPLYYGIAAALRASVKLVIILLFSLIGIGGSYGSPGSASASTPSPTRAPPSPACGESRSRCTPFPLKAGMSIGMALISVELLIMLCILLFIPRDYAGPCFIGFAIGESLGAAVLRIAGGIFTKIADIGSDLMKIVFNIKEDDARNPGVIADCTGDNAGDSVGPTADGFETYGVTGVALISFILAGRDQPAGPGPAPGLDLRHAHHDDRRLGRLVPDQQRRSPARSTARPTEDELRAPADLAGLAHLRRLDRPDLPRLRPAGRRPRRRHPLVEAGHRHHLRHPGRAPSFPSSSRSSPRPARGTSRRS